MASFTTFFFLAFLCLAPAVFAAPPRKPIDVPFSRNYAPTWAFDHINYINGGTEAHLKLDKYTGTGFQSKGSYLFGHFSMRIKMVPGDSARTVTAFYLSSQNSEHDEIDFEFLGNRTAQPYILQTNVFTGGKGDREHRIFLCIGVKECAEDFLMPLSRSTVPITSSVQTPELFRGSLKGYQLKGLQWLVNCDEKGLNGILADEMGLGKTIQAMAFLTHLAEEKNIWGPFLVVAPASVLNNWADEVSRFCPDLKTLPYWGGLQERVILRKNINPKRLYRRDAGFHILITSYQRLVSDENYFRRVKWQYMVLDEAQAIKSANRDPSWHWKFIWDLVSCHNLWGISWRWSWVCHRWLPSKDSTLRS